MYKFTVSNRLWIVLSPFVWASYKNTCIHPIIAFLTWVVMRENIIIDFNAFRHSNHLRFLICYTGRFDEKKTVELVSVAFV